MGSNIFVDLFWIRGSCEDRVEMWNWNKSVIRSRKWLSLSMFVIYFWTFFWYRLQVDSVCNVLKIDETVFRNYWIIRDPLNQFILWLNAKFLFGCKFFFFCWNCKVSLVRKFFDARELNLHVLVVDENSFSV